MRATCREFLKGDAFFASLVFAAAVVQASWMVLAMRVLTAVTAASAAASAAVEAALSVMRGMLFSAVPTAVLSLSMVSSTRAQS